MVASYGDPWQVCVVPNLFPSLDPDFGNETHAVGSTLDGFSTSLFASRPALGMHEVVIEAPTHVTRSGDLSLSQVKLMLRAYRDRMRFMREQSDISYVQVIKNSGEAAGASLPHAHSQIFGIPFVPEQLQRELDGAKRHLNSKSCCLFCDIIEREVDGPRIVEATEGFVTWCPYASRVGYELQIAPKLHQSRFEDSTDQTLDLLASVLLRTLRRLDEHPRIEAFNYLLHTLPFNSKNDASYHWHIEVLPRIAKEAGFEWGTGVHINTIAPERAANELASF